MFDAHDFSDIEPFIASGTANTIYELPVAETTCDDNVLASIVVCSNSSHAKMTSIQRMSVDATFAVCMGEYNRLIQNTPHINEIFPFLTTEDKIHAIGWNRFVNDTSIMSVPPRQITKVSPYNYGLSMEVVRTLMDNDIFPNSPIPHDYLHKLDVFNIASNPFLPQDMYTTAIKNEMFFLKELPHNDGLDESNVMFLYSTMLNRNLYATNEILYHKNMPQEFIDKMWISMESAPVVSSERAEDYIGYSNEVNSALALNDNLTIEQKVRVISLMEPHSVIAPKIFDDIDSLEIFEYAINNNIGQPYHYLMRVRDEAELLSSTPWSAEWAIRNSPYPEVVDACLEKFPEHSDMVKGNAFLDYNRENHC